MVPAQAILAITVGLAAVTKILQRKFGNQEKVKVLQNQMKEDNKRFKELFKEAGKNKKEIDELQARILHTNMEIMNSTMKLNFIILPVFLLALWGMGFLFAGQVFQSIIPLPRFLNFSIWSPESWIPACIFNGGECLTMQTGYYKAYFFYYLIATIVLGIVVKIYDTVKKKK